MRIKRDKQVILFAQGYFKPKREKSKKLYSRKLKHKKRAYDF